MSAWCPENEIHRLEKSLASTALGFSASYMAVKALNEMIREYPFEISFVTVKNLETLLTDNRFCVETQALAFYREITDTIATVLIRCVERIPFESAYSALKSGTAHLGGVQQRAASEALGSLPLNVKGPALKEAAMVDIPELSFDELLSRNFASPTGKIKFIGRSIVLDTRNKNTCLVIKKAGSFNSLRLLENEARWMTHLMEIKSIFRSRFEIPRPFLVKNSFVFKPTNLPFPVEDGTNGNACCGALAYRAHKDYFHYPNTASPNMRIEKGAFKSIIRNNAFILGQLTGMGIIHTAPIPLFHNRTQRLRRNDAGLYEWPRGGRLDQWLSSSQYPNFSLSGIRDFEHLVPFSGPDKLLYRHIGTHLMSFVLVCGSYFRNKEPHRVGKDPDGSPVDTRDLFDKPYFAQIIETIFTDYYEGFVGEHFEGTLPLDTKRLADRLVEEMGCDRHMEEVLRVSDQQVMSREEFEDFLFQRGLTEDRINNMTKGVSDIPIESGPHLGEFNGRISVPELIEFLAKSSAFCIADKFYKDRRKVLS